MRTGIISFVLAFFILLISPVSALADDNAQKPIRFELTIKPNQQYAQINLGDNDKFIKTFNAKAEFIKLNTTTNNYHIKVTFTNNGITTLYHQLAIIEEVENAEVKYPDNTTDYIKTDDGKQISKTLPYYNYGSIKLLQSTPREWYVTNTGKPSTGEIEIKGFIINKEIPIALDPKIVSQVDAGAVATLTKFLTGLRENDLDVVLSTIAGPDIYWSKDLHKNIKNWYKWGYLLDLAMMNSNIVSATQVRPDMWMFGVKAILPMDGQLTGGYIEISNLGSPYGWLITEY